MQLGEDAMLGAGESRGESQEKRSGEVDSEPQYHRATEACLQLPITRPPGMEEKSSPFSQIIHIQVLILIAKNLLAQTPSAAIRI